MFPVAVLTWRLGNLDLEVFESLIPSSSKVNTVFEEFLNYVEGVYFLETCQRIIVVVETHQTWIIDDLINMYYNILSSENSIGFKPEIFFGIDGLFHLAKVVSGFDSIVLGEYEIQHQFKAAYLNSQPYLGSNLKTFMQYIIRIGKRVRQKVQLNRTSTIEAVEAIYREKFQNSSSITIIGTGKMGKLSLRYLKKYKDKITVHSTVSDRIGQYLDQVPIHPLNAIGSTQIIITATSKPKIITLKFLKQQNLENDLLIFDLGMPRNCDPEISKSENIKIIDIEKLVDLSNTSDQIQCIGKAMNIIEEQVNQIIKEYHHQLKSKMIVDLRSELYEFAKCNKPDSDFSTDEKNYQQFINGLIHISQKHIEKVIFEGFVSND